MARGVTCKGVESAWERNISNSSTPSRLKTTEKRKFKGDNSLPIKCCLRLKVTITQLTTVRWHIKGNVHSYIRTINLAGAVVSLACGKNDMDVGPICAQKLL